MTQPITITLPSPELVSRLEERVQVLEDRLEELRRVAITEPEGAGALDATAADPGLPPRLHAGGLASLNRGHGGYGSTEGVDGGLPIW